MKEIFIIAEAGINHNGNLDIAKKLIDVAFSSGANAIKFQKRNIDKVYTQDFLNAFRESPWGNTQRHQKEGLEFGKKEYDEIAMYCKNKKIELFFSAWDLDSLDFVDQYDTKFNKVASPMLVDHNFLHKLATNGRHNFISTGMSTLDQIESAVEIFKSNNASYELMHCISTYPMKTEHANLLTIPKMRKHFNCNIGYSGHESGLICSYAAASLGISSLERHITLDRTMYGSDQAASLEPNGFNELIRGIRKIETCLGVSIMGKVLDDEIPIAKKLREHIK